MKMIGRLACALVLPLTLPSCAEMYAQQPVGASIELTENCAAGPYCVTGAVSGQNGAPVPGVRCSAEWAEQEPTVVYSDRHGLFLMSGLSFLPRKLRFEKDGFETQPVSVLAAMHRRSAGAEASTPGTTAAAGADSSTGSNGASAQISTGPEAGTSTIRPLLGEDLAPGDDITPEELFDFGSGSTMRVLITMRRVK